MAISVLKCVLPWQKSATNAFIFLPDAASAIKPVFALFTHGFTSHKGSILNWPTRLAEEGVPSVLFDLPGHYLGSYSEVDDFEIFAERAHELFEAAYDKLASEMANTLGAKPGSSVVLGGHSLGALLALRALELPIFQNLQKLAVCVGLGLAPEGTTHIFETPFYKSTLNIRAQLVSPALDPSVVFPWIQEAKKNISISDKRIHLITGEDDLVVGKDGTERFARILLDSGNDVSVEKPNRLPHTAPEMAASHIKKFLKNENFI